MSGAVVLVVVAALGEPLALAVTAGLLARAGLLKVELKRPVERQPRRTSEPPAGTGGQD